MSAPTLSLESIKQEVDNLASQLQRNAKVVADTGRRLLQIEVSKEREAIGRLPGFSKSKSKSKDSVDKDDDSSNESEDEDDNDHSASEVVRNDDIVELVTELQGQLDLL